MVFIVWNVHKVYCTIYSCVLKRDSHVQETPFDLIIALLYSFKPPPEFNTFCTERVSRLLHSKETSRISPTVAQYDTPYHTLSGTFFTPRSTNIPLPRQPTTNNPNCRRYFSHVHSFVHSFIHSFSYSFIYNERRGGCCEVSPCYMLNKRLG